jgi:hypothetical protein
VGQPTALVGAPNDNDNSGAAWVFTRFGGVWSQQGNKLIGDFGSFGAAVALSGDGNTDLIGEPAANSGIGAVWVFTRSAGVWSQPDTRLSGSGGVRKRLVNRSS